MCGRYYIESEDSTLELLAIIDEVNRRSKVGPVKTGEIFPTDLVPVIANNRSQRQSAFAMRWGYSMGDDRRPIINARSETAASKPMFKDGMAQRRCLIPATHYFEWAEQSGKMVKYAIRQSGSDMIYMAGLYRIEHGTDPVFTILTRSPAENIAFIHDRMPVIIPAAAMNDWLNISYNANEVIRAAVLDVVFQIA
ncbi:MAG TPA: SOS response-associated peptidase [Candidatus Pullichristensenella excrementipullorum]|nr:SOS response-associated peptidase [Candidatus Pullichristensenella excrementipullorum]